jgi:hypothetical protein
LDNCKEQAEEHIRHKKIFYWLGLKHSTQELNPKIKKEQEVLLRQLSWYVCMYLCIFIIIIPPSFVANVVLIDVVLIDCETTQSVSPTLKY